MMTTKLEPGTMVKLTERREGSSIKARSAPRSFNALLGEELDIVICDIPNETHALFINSQPDAFNAAMRKKGRGPYGFSPPANEFYLVLWEGRPVWVASSDTVVERL